LASGWFKHGSVAMVRAVIGGIAGGKLELSSLSTSSWGAVVDRTFFLVWSRWPLIIGTDNGGYLEMALVVRPGKSGEYPRSSAVMSVDSTGEKTVACANATRSAGRDGGDADLWAGGC
jgi:hypothetical protein